MTLFAQRKRTNLEIVSEEAVRHQHTNLAIPLFCRRMRKPFPPAEQNVPSAAVQHPQPDAALFLFKEDLTQSKEGVCLPGDSHHNISYRAPCGPETGSLYQDSLNSNGVIWKTRGRLAAAPDEAKDFRFRILTFAECLVLFYLGRTYQYIMNVGQLDSA